MKSFSDQQVLYNMNLKYQHAKDASKEGVGTPRGVGMAGRIAEEWIRWRTEAKDRGLV